MSNNKKNPIFDKEENKAFINKSFVFYYSLYSNFYVTNQQAF